MLDTAEAPPLSAARTARLVDYRTAAARVSLSVRTLQRLVGSGDFPAPVVVSPNRLAFVEAEIDSWLASRPRAA